MYKPYHLIGLELGVSILSAALRKEPTGEPREFRGDAAAVAKRRLVKGEMLDGEGGYTVWGKSCRLRRASKSARCRSASRTRSNCCAISRLGRWCAGAMSTSPTAPAVRARREMEAMFAAPSLRKAVA